MAKPPGKWSKYEARQAVRHWQNKYAQDLAVQALHASDPKDNVFTHYEGGKLSGVISWHFEEGDVGEPISIYVERLATDTGKGFGKLMLMQVIEESVETDVPIILAPSPDAIGFYKHYGFQEFETYSEELKMILNVDKARAALEEALA